MVNYHHFFPIFFSFILGFVLGFHLICQFWRFDEGYLHMFGDNKLIILKDGKSAHISLDERTGWFILFSFICMSNSLWGFILISICFIKENLFIFSSLRS